MIILCILVANNECELRMLYETTPTELKFGKLSSIELDRIANIIAII